MIELIHMTRSFGSFNLFEDTTLSFPDHGLYLLTGDNGSGKTAFLYYLALLDKDFRGKYLFEGNRIDYLTEKRKDVFRSRNIFLMLPKGNLIDFLSVGENRNLFVKDESPYCFDSLDSKRSVLGLSGGEETLLTLSNGLSGKKKLCLLDEITSSLSQKHVEEVMQILEKASEETLIILATHDSRIFGHGKKLRIENKTIHFLP